MERSKYTPIYRSFTKRLTVCGVPETIFYLNVAIGVFIVLQLKMISLTPIFLLTHFLLRYLGRKDPDLFLILIRKTLKKYYSY